MSCTNHTTHTIHPAPRLARPGPWARLTALVASAAITLTIVSALADYGLPADRDGTLAAASAPVPVK